MIREQDRPALRRFIASVFSIENAHDAELNAIAHDESISPEQRADKYLDFILDRLEFVPDITSDVR